MLEFEKRKMKTPSFKVSPDLSSIYASSVDNLDTTSFISLSSKRRMNEWIWPIRHKWICWRKPIIDLGLFDTDDLILCAVLMVWWVCLFITQKVFNCCSLRIPVINIQKKVCVFVFEVVMVLPSLCSSVIKRKKQDKEIWPTVKAYWEFKSNKEVSPRGQGRLLGSSDSSSLFDSKFLFVHQNIPVYSFQCIYFKSCGTFHLWDWILLMGLLGMLLNFFRRLKAMWGCGAWFDALVLHSGHQKSE